MLAAEAVRYVAKIVDEESRHMDIPGLYPSQDALAHGELEFELFDLFLAAQWVVFPFDFVQFQLMLHTIELLLKLQLVQLPLHLVQLLIAWLGCETGATCCLVPKLVELPLRLIEFLGALEILKLGALVEFVYLFLLGRWRRLVSELVGRRPEGGMRQKKS